MEKEIIALEEEFKQDSHSAITQQDLEALRIKYLGRKSALASLFTRLPTLSKEEKITFGRRLNVLKNQITAALEEKTKGARGSEAPVDLTFPSSDIQRGSLHVLTQVSLELCTIFEKLGFCVTEGTEIEDEWHNFTALNIPLEHPSRDAFDTFYLDIPEGSENCGKFLLRSHTSPSQIRIMHDSKPPLAVISPGRVYRPDQVDASHSFMFHQIEGFAVDTGITFAHLKGVLLHFAREFFSSDVNLRFRPHFFPFTEPSAEVDISCFACSGKRPQTTDQRPKQESQKCSVCKGKGWLEILGCGMIHPNVLTACGISAKKYKGFAFGMGVERPAMLKYGINDIRLFFENDIRFLEQF
ncbi:MAG: phenylalanine--tRNA ligase subunit alpha [Candidatus Omnitrophica bacterium]|nr:phenylalanine--tRNA ligase subunit alpha [Candidatus Omnitrophota bacterium]